MVKSINNVFEKYEKEGVYQNPSKSMGITADYILKKVQYIFSNYVRGVDAISYSSNTYFDMLRLYSAGKQPEDKYKPYFLGSASSSDGRTFDSNGNDIGGVSNGKFDVTEWLRKAMGHMNWTIMSPAPKIMNKIHSSFYGNLYDITINCVDENSINEQTDKKWEAWVQSQSDYIQFMQQMSNVVGFSYTPPEPKFETITELELFEANGGFKLNYAKEGEKVIKDGWNISNKDELDEKIINDLVNLNIAGYRVYYDREIGKEMVRWVDPAMAGIQYSKHNDFRDSSYAYEIELVPAYRLVAMGIDIDKVPQIAQRYAGIYGNPEWTENYMDNIGNDLKCGFFKVPVMDVEFIDTDVKKNVKYTSWGQEKIREYEEGERLSSSKQYIETKIHKVYQAKWIIDTEIMLDWGLKPNQPKREKNQSVLSFHFIKGKTDKSLTEQLIPVYDDWQLNWLKYLDGKAKAVKSGYAYEWEALQGMLLGGNKVDPLDMYRFHKTTGDMFYTRRNRHTQGTTSNPIMPLNDGIGNTINNFILGLDTNARLIEEITGINPVSLGSTADPRAGKAVTEISVSTSQSPIKNIFDKLFLLKSHTSLDLLMRVQLDMRNSPTVRKRYASVIGELGVKTLIEAEGKGVSFGTQLIAMPTMEESQVIIGYVNTALAGGKNGNAGLSIPDALYITRRLKEGANMKEIELYIDFRMKKSEQMQQEYAQQNAQAQMQGQRQLEQLKAENARMMAVLEVEKENAINYGKFVYEARLSDINSLNKRDEIKVQQGLPPDQPDQQPPVPKMLELEQQNQGQTMQQG